MAAIIEWPPFCLKLIVLNKNPFINMYALPVYTHLVP